jgi:putative drug exporter of the RND superfamily
MSGEAGNSRGFRLLLSIAGVATQRSRLVVGIWIASIAILAFVGRNLDRELGIHPPFIDGTGSKRAHEISLREFGSDNAMVVMLRGPRGAVTRQGHVLAARLDALPRMLVVSPWVRNGTIDGLSPSPNVAALIVRVEANEAKGVTAVLPPVRSQVDRVVRAPVHASIAGFPAVVDSLHSSSERAAELGEMIAVPVLLLVLLVVFRSVLAAAMPVLIGGAVVAATRGLLSLLNGLMQLDLFALGVTAMMGLALGVDYSLLVISRYREERRRNDFDEAVRATVAATAKSVVPAGCGLILAMGVAALILPGSIARSVSIAVSVATLLSMVSAICVVPALLTVLGDNLDRWSLPARPPATQSASLRWSRRIARRPWAVAAVVLCLLFLSGWAFNLGSGAASVELLPPGDPGRQQQEEVEAALGPGWIAPMEVVVDGNGSPITSVKRLRAFAAFQRHVEKDPGVQTMAGFSRIVRGAEEIGGIEGELVKQERGLDRLAGGIAKARKGADLGSSGLQSAAAGSSTLEAGLGAANEGAEALAKGLQAAGRGSSRLSDGLDQMDQGSGKLAQGAAKASNGAGRLADALGKAREKTGELSGSSRLLENAMRSGDARLGELHEPLQGSEEQLLAAWRALQRMTVGRGDPEYAAALAAVEEAGRRLTGKDMASGEPLGSSQGVTAGVERAEGQFGVGLYLASRMGRDGRQASKGIEKLAEASTKLHQGLRRLTAGSLRVSDGVGALAGGGAKLSPALRRLGQGEEHLSGGLALLEAGAGRLAGGLDSGAEKSKLLGSGLRRIESGLASRDDSSNLSDIQRSSPGVFHSAYFVLAGLDGSPPRQRSQLDSLININRGGTDARMLVVPRDAPTTEAARETKERLERDAEALGRRTGTEVVVGGVAPGEIDVNDAIREQTPLMRLALSLVTLIILIPVMRSLTIPLIAAVVNLIAVSAAFGVLALLFNGSLLGGPGYVDAAVIPTTMMVMFGLAIDYEIFVFARIREEYVRTGSTETAVRNGLDRTAHVVTGAAIIMISVFLAFSVSDLMTVRNFGVAQAVAVSIDAFIVRLIIVPVAMNRLGRWSWWLPKWLDRLLPRGRSRASPGQG